MTAPEPSSGVAEFGLDLDKAREAVAALREVYDGLLALHQRAFDLARLPVTAHDSVSLEAFEFLTLKAAGPPGSGSFIESIEVGIKYVESLIKQMEEDIQEQEALDLSGQREIERA